MTKATVRKCTSKQVQMARMARSSRGGGMKLKVVKGTRMDRNMKSQKK